MSEALHPAVLFLSPDTDTPTGGIRTIYRSVELLVEAGIVAAVLHERPGFRCSWFESPAPVTSVALRPVTEHDVLVIPEIYGPRLHEIAPGTPKVIFNQNAFQTFERWPIPAGLDERPGVVSPYRSPEVVATLAVSEHNREYLEYAFPGLVVHRIVPDAAAPEASARGKEDLLAFMPRKNRDHAIQVLSILSARGALDRWKVVAIDGMTSEETLATLRRARVFLSFGYPEGIAGPPLEAMASGCVVIGYDGGGAREYFTADTGYPVPFGDILAYAQTVERVIVELTADPTSADRRVASAQQLVRDRYSPEASRASTVGAWRRILEDIGAQHVLADAPLPEGSILARTIDLSRDVRIEQLEAEIDQRRAEVEAARADVEAARAACDRVVDERDDAARVVDDLLASRSWRITRPLRELRDRLQGRG